MKLGSSSVKRNNIGLSHINGGYIGNVSLTQSPNNTAPEDLGLYPLYEQTYQWSESTLAGTLYSPSLVAPVFNIMDYGAVGDNSANDVGALRAAMAAQKLAGEGTVYIPAGVYAMWADAPTEEYLQVPSVELFQSNLVIEGDGPTQTILNFRVAGGGDPNEDQLYRGFAFTTYLTPDPINGIVIRGLRATGNAYVTENAGLYEGVGSMRGWDTTHKFLAIFGTPTNTITNITIEDCQLDGWRGEIVYSGGGLELGNFTIRRCLIGQTNASALSMGGDVLLEDCEFFACLNGTECLLIGTQGMTVRNCIFRPNAYMPTGMVGEGRYGLVHHGLSNTSALFEDNLFVGCEAGVFLAEMAHNTIIQNNTFKDSRWGVYSIYLNQYPNNPTIPIEEHNRFEDISILSNVFHAETAICDAAIESFSTPGVNWLVDNNQFIKTGENRWNRILSIRGASGFYTVTNNTMATGNPAFYYGHIEGYRATTWSNNTVTGDYASGSLISSYLPVEDPATMDITPSWPKLFIIDVGGTGVMQREGAVRLTGDVNGTPINLFPTGFQFTVARGGGIGACEIKPDPSWNTLARGYMLNAGASLTLQMGVGGKFDFVSYTPPTVNLRTHTEAVGSERWSAADIAFIGQLSVTLAPSVAHTFSTFSGVAIGETVTINCNANVTLDHVPGVMEMSTGVNYVSSGTVALSATRDAAGVLQVTIP